MTFQHLPRWHCRGPIPPQKSFYFFGDLEQGSGFHANFVIFQNFRISLQDFKEA
jgi:hypothetical protein